MSIQLDLDQLAVQRIGHYNSPTPIVFLHDSLGCIELWRDFPRRLSEVTKCDAILYDRQGYGQSCTFSYTERDNNYLEQEADILNALLDHWGLDQVLLFGHSDGASIALITAAKYPDRIAGLISEAAHVFVESITLQGIQDALHAYQTTTLKTKLEKYHGKKTAALFEAWTKTWTTDTFRSWNIEHFLPNIICPSLVIQGEADEYGTLQQVHAILEQTTGSASSLIIPNIGHTPHKEELELVLEQATHFIWGVLD